MKKTDTAGMKRQVKELQRAMGTLGPVMRGSLVVIGTRNKQPYFSLNKDKKTRLIYLGKRREKLAKRLAANYKRLQEIVEEMTELNMILLKHDYEQET